MTTRSPSFYDAFGKEVPTEAQVDALECAIEQMGAAPLASDTAIREAAQHVKDDKPEQALLALRSVVDLTGAYRLLAMLCSGTVRAA